MVVNIAIMFRALLIVHAAAIFGHAHASSAGCYPNYAAGRTYAIGERASTSATTATPISYVVCSPPGVGKCPSSGLKAEGGFSTSDLYNYQCISDDLCSNDGYAPGSINSELAWTRDSTPCLPVSYILHRFTLHEFS